MGNRQSLLQQLDIYKPPLDDLVLKDPGNLFKIYKHKYKGYELMAHKITLNDEDQLPILIDNYKARYQHHYLVSTLFLACEDYSACGGYYETMIFYQRIFTNLSKIKDIPFQDVLHFYAVAFKGFQILYRRFGYFQIYEDMFHLGQDSKLKVWCNRDISKNSPEPYLLDKNGSEQDMLRKIIFIISENTDPYTDRINLKEKLLIFGVRNFQMANQSLRQICRQYNLSVPQRLTCISSLPSEEVRLMLDLYSSNSNYFSVNETVSNTTTNPIPPLPVPNSPTHSSMQLINNMPPHQSRMENLMTPHFQKPSPVLHVPITQQFAIPQLMHQTHGLNAKQPQKRETELSMIHTFNRTPQMPEVDHRKGIDLSLAKNKERRPSWHSIKKLQESRSRSLQAQNNQNFVPQNSQKVYSVEKKPDIKINFVSKNNGWVNPLNNGSNMVQRFDRTLRPQEINETRQNYHVIQPQQAPKIIEPSKPRVVFAQSSSPQYHSQPHSSHQQPHANYYTPILTNSILNQSSSQKSTQILKKSGSFAQTINPGHQKRNSSSNIYAQPSKPTYQPLLHQFRQRRASSKQKGSSQRVIMNESKKYSDQFSTTSLQKNASTPVFAKAQTETTKALQNPFQKVQNNLSTPSTLINQIQNLSSLSNNKLYLQVPLNPSIVPQFNAHSASSRYLYSNKDLNDNIPDIRYKKASSPKKTINKLFDTKMQELQSFNESKFGTQNSLKEPYAENSRVLQIIGREKKDSITSAFGDDEALKKFDVKDFTLQNKNQTKIQSSYKFGDSFTDPKILEILKRPSSKALKTQLNTIKKVSKTSKPIDFAQEYVKKPFISKEIRQDILKLDSWQIQGDKNKDFNGKSNFQGFPSMSNLSQINKIDENSFNEEKSNLLLSNKKNQDRKSRFSEQKVGSAKKDQNAVSQFYNFDYQSPTYDYSFSSKRQVPIQDNEWRNKYATMANSYKDDSTMVQKTNDFRMVPEKPFSYITGFNSNESLASLEFELSQKLANKNSKDHIKEQIETSGQFSGLKNDSVQISSPGISRKYNPKLDPEISKDLERFRKQKQQVKSN